MGQNMGQEPADWQSEHEQISTALDVETLDVNLFRSKSLWVPTRARGVFGGQVISQALVSATKCVAPAFSLHSLHCYFLLSASPAVPIIYHVDRVREGRSYTTRFVKAVQNGRIVFVMMCSFQKPEPWQPTHEWPFPPDVPKPDECELEEVRMRRIANQEGLDERRKQLFIEYAAERSKSPISVKAAKENFVSKDGHVVYMYWMKAKNVPKYEAPFQKCILAYLSDLYFIGTAPKVLGLRRFSKGPNATAMTSSLDHSVYYYDDNFDCGDWLLYVMVSPRAGSGRAVVHGRLYTESGTLVAVTSQEGVVRADRRGPEDKPKL